MQRQTEKAIQEILTQYQRVIDDNPVKTEQAVFHSHEALTAACIGLDFNHSFDKVKTLIAAKSNKAGREAGFKKILADRQRFNDTLLSPGQQPDNLTNRFCAQIFQALFPDYGPFEYFQMLGIKTILVPSYQLIKVNGKNYPRVRLEELKFTKEAAAHYLINWTNCLLSGSMIVPLETITGHTDTLDDRRGQMNARVAYYMGIHAALQQSRYANVRRLLMRHPQINRLYGKIAELSENGQTLREALLHLKQHLTVSGTRYTGRDDVPQSLSYALLEFRHFIDKFPDPQTVLQSVKIKTDKEIITLKKFLHRLSTNVNQCVEMAASMLDNFLLKKDNVPFLNQSPILTEDKRQALKNEIHYFWQKEEAFTWMLLSGDLPLDYLQQLSSNLEIENSEEAIALLSQVSQRNVYQALLTNSSLARLLNGRAEELVMVLVHLSNDQMRHFLQAAQQELKWPFTAGDYISILLTLSTEQRDLFVEVLFGRLLQVINTTREFSDLLKLLTPHWRTMICSGFHDKWPQLLKTRDDFRRVFRFVSVKQCAEICQLLRPELVKLIEGFCYVVRDASPEHAAVVYNAFQDDFMLRMNTIDDLRLALRYLPIEALSGSLKPYLGKLIQQTKHFKEAVWSLPDERCAAIYNALKPELINMITSMYDLQCVLEYLPAEQLSDICLSLKPNLVKIINNVQDFAYVLKFIPALYCAEVCEIFKSELANWINSAADFMVVCEYLAAEQRTVVYDAVRPVNLVKTLEDFSCVCLHLTAEQTAAVYETVKLELMKGITSKDLLFLGSGIFNSGTFNDSEYTNKFWKDYLEPFFNADEITKDIKWSIRFNVENKFISDYMEQFRKKHRTLDKKFLVYTDKDPESYIHFHEKFFNYELVYTGKGCEPLIYLAHYVSTYPDSAAARVVKQIKKERLLARCGQEVGDGYCVTLVDDLHDFQKQNSVISTATACMQRMTACDSSEALLKEIHSEPFHDSINQCHSMASMRAFALNSGYRLVGFSVNETMWLTYDPHTHTYKTLSPGQKILLAAENLGKKSSVPFIVDTIVGEETILIGMTAKLYHQLPIQSTEIPLAGGGYCQETRLDCEALKKVEQSSPSPDFCINNLIAADNANPSKDEKIETTSLKNLGFFKLTNDYLTTGLMLRSPLMSQLRTCQKLIESYIEETKQSNSHTRVARANHLLEFIKKEITTLLENRQATEKPNLDKLFVIVCVHYASINDPYSHLSIGLEQCLLTLLSIDDKGKDSLLYQQALDKRNITLNWLAVLFKLSDKQSDPVYQFLELNVKKDERFKLLEGNFDLVIETFNILKNFDQRETSHETLSTNDFDDVIERLLDNTIKNTSTLQK